MIERRFVRQNLLRIPDIPDSALAPPSTTVPVKVKVTKGFVYRGVAQEPGTILTIPRWLFDDLLVRGRVERMRDE